MTPAIAVVIPVHNRAAVVRRAIESVLNQSRNPDQLVIVDDGSSDDLADALAPYSAHVTLVRQDRGGVSSARNAGVEVARADFVAFLDSDDNWDRRHLERLEKAIVATRGEAWLYFADIALSASRGGASAWATAGFEIEGRHALSHDGAEWVMLPHQPMWIQASAIRRDAYVMVGGSDERLTCRGDTHLFLKLGMGHPICAVAGIAGDVTDVASNSLTRRYQSGFVYWQCTVQLYRSVLDGDDISLVHRAQLNHRLAVAHWALARSAGVRAPAQFFTHRSRSLRHDHRLIPGRVWRRLLTPMAQEA